MTNVSRILALGGSKCRILRGLEAPGALLEAGSDECLSGGLHVRSSRFGTSLRMSGGLHRSSGFGSLRITASTRDRDGSADFLLIGYNEHELFLINFN